MSALISPSFLTEARQYFEQLPEVTAEATRLTLNQVSDRTALPLFRRKVGSQVAFPSGYVNEERLFIAKRATDADLQVNIKGRDRATSLARFAPGYTPENSRGKPISVQVSRGRTVQLKRAFLVRLNNGNIGLAIRLKPGQRPDAAYKPVALDNGLWLLYGPSVDQVLRAVFEDSLPEIGEALSKEFSRQFIRLSSRG